MEVQSLLVPILEAVDRFGLKTWHLRKFHKDVERFYQKQYHREGSTRRSRCGHTESGSTATGTASSRS